MIKQKENAPTAGTDEGTPKDLLNNIISLVKGQAKLLGGRHGEDTLEEIK